MNPFVLDDTPQNRIFLRQWVASLIPDPTPEDHDDIAGMVTVAYDYMPRSHRSLASLYKGSLRPDSAARRYLAKWVAPDQYGPIFNASEDTTTEGLASRLVGYDCTTAFDDPGLASPLIAYLTHRIRALSIASRRPSLVYIDETSPMLRSPQFRATFTSGLQEGRKLRQAYVCAFQDPAAIAAADISSVVRGQCQTAIFLRNTQASPEASDFRNSHNSR